MAAKKKTAKRKADICTVPDHARLPDALQALGLLSTLAERVVVDPDNLLGMAQRIVASVEASRSSWLKTAVDLELRAELAEDALRALLESGLKARPSVPLVIAQAPQINGLPHPTFGDPGDGPTGRYSREART